MSDGSGYDQTRSAIEAVWRIESPRLIAGLARITGDVGTELTGAGTDPAGH